VIGAEAEEESPDVLCYWKSRSGAICLRPRSTALHDTSAGYTGETFAHHNFAHHVCQTDDIFIQDGIRTCSHCGETFSRTAKIEVSPRDAIVLPRPTPEDRPGNSRSWEYQEATSICIYCSADLGKPVRLRVHLRRVHYESSKEIDRILRELKKKVAVRPIPRLQLENKRRVHLMGESSYGIVLPKGWCERNRVQKGEYLEISEKGDRVEIIAQPTEDRTPS
jgi:hypothetical protein